MAWVSSALPASFLTWELTGLYRRSEMNWKSEHVLGYHDVTTCCRGNGATYWTAVDDGHVYEFPNCYLQGVRDRFVVSWL